MKIAVIGAGISGVSASYLLSKKHEVHLFEKDSRLGGHTNTVEVKLSNGSLQGIDTGFIVLNDCNYGVLHNLFSEWQVDIRWSDMSFSYYDKKLDYYYAGTDVFGLFPKLKMLFSLEHLNLIREIYSFGKLGLDFIGTNSSFGISSNFSNINDMTLGQFLEEKRISINLINKYLLPMGSAIWSVPMEQILEFPAKSFFSFFKNHGLLDFKYRPRWQTVVGGSSSYLEKFKQKFNGKIELNSKVVSVIRKTDLVEISFINGSKFECDEVVFACHADQVLSILNNPSKEEVDLFSKWRYQENKIVLHTDISILPPNRCCWASWNYHSNIESKAVLTYYMNKLQGLNTSQDFLVSLNYEEDIDPTKILYKINYDHPVYDFNSSGTQDKLIEIQGLNRTFYCGSYCGHGFHEDAARSGAQVALLHEIAI